MTKGYREGFTLLELLLVLAIIGILAALGFSNFMSAQREAQLQEATAQFATDLQRARSTAQRYNQNASVRLGNIPSTYTLSVNGVDTVRQLPHGARVVAEGSVAVVSYTAPYGEINATSRRFVISSTRTPDVRYIKVIGVTGKVLISDL